MNKLPFTLLGEEDFLPDDTTLVNEPIVENEDAVESEADDMQELQQTGETVVVGSNPVDVSLEGDSLSYDEPIVTGGQNVGNGNTNISSEVTGQNVVVGIR